MTSRFIRSNGFLGSVGDVWGEVCAQHKVLFVLTQLGQGLVGAAVAIQQFYQMHCFQLQTLNLALHIVPHIQVDWHWVVILRRRGP